jgi:excinuclease ABC subunit A
VITNADWIIDLGPGAGKSGGRIVVCGQPHDIAKSRDSRTAEYLSRRLSQTHRRKSES